MQIRNRSAIEKTIAEDLNLSQKEVNLVIDSFINAIIESLIERKSVKVNGLGIIYLINHKRKTMPHPLTRLMRTYPERVGVRLKLAKRLSIKVNEAIFGKKENT